jgi:L-fucose isomerase-like protein
MICYVVSSSLQRQVELGKRVANTVKSLLNRFDVKVKHITSPKEVEAQEGCIVVVASGGTEKTIVEIVEKCKPVLIWAIPYNNSLPSALEVYSLYKGNVKLIYSDLDETALQTVDGFMRLCKSLKKLKNTNLGLIGGVSEWILTLDEDSIKRFANIVKIDMDELIAEVESADMELDLDVEHDLTKDDLLKALKVYKALKKIVKRYNLSALTIRCFDLLKIDTTACLALSMLNDESITAGCEGDLDALLTMVILQGLTDQPCWMANFSRFDLKSNTVTFSHCTVPFSMVASAKLTTHMESGKGVAVEGVLRNEAVTIARFSRGKMLVTTGRIVKSGLGDRTLCRTQVEIKLDCKVEELIENSLGNHHVIVYGNHKSILLDFCKITGVEPIVF